MENLKQLLKSGKVVVFDNETTFNDDFRSAECSFRDEPVNAWANGFKIEFNGEVVVSSTRFDVAEPLTRKRIVGFRTLENEFLKPEKA